MGGLRLGPDKKKGPKAGRVKHRIQWEPLLDRNKREQFLEFLKSRGYAGKQGIKNPLNFDKNLLIGAIQKYLEIFGEFPSSYRLDNQELRMLDHAVSAHGGYDKIKGEMGLASPKRPKKDEVEDPKEHLIEFVNNLVVELGHFPTKKELQKRKLWWVFEWAKEELGGMIELRKAVNTKADKRGEESLRKWGNLERELLAVKKEIGYEPSWTELEELGRYDILNAVRHHGGMKKIRKKLGWTMLMEGKKELEKLKTWDCFEERMEGIIQKNKGKFPSDRYLRSIHESRMMRASKKFGGLAIVAVIMGYEPGMRVGLTSWKHWQNVKSELRKVEKELGYPPSWDEVYNATSAGFMGALRVYHGGMTGVRRRLGWPSLRRERKTFSNWDEFRKYLISLVKVFGELPSSDKLRNWGYGDIAYTAKDYGGMGAVRVRLGLRPYKKSEELSYRHWRNVEKKLSELRDYLGVPPPYCIVEMQSGLASAIQKYHGGFRKARSKFLGKEPEKNKKDEIKVGGLRKRIFLNAKTGETKAKSEIVDFFMKRIRRISYRLDYSGRYREDLRQEAVVALLDYLEICDKPSAFYGGVMKYMYGRLVKFMSMNLKKWVTPEKESSRVATALRRATKLLTNKFGREPFADEICQVLQLEQWELEVAMRTVKTPLRIHFEEHGRRPLEEKKEVVDAEKRRRERYPLFNEKWLVGRLIKEGKTEKEAEIITRHLFDGSPAKDIAKEMNVPRLYVRAVIRDYFTKVIK